MKKKARPMATKMQQSVSPATVDTSRAVLSAATSHLKVMSGGSSSLPPPSGASASPSTPKASTPAASAPSVTPPASPSPRTTRSDALFHRGARFSLEDQLRAAEAELIWLRRELEQTRLQLQRLRSGSHVFNDIGERLARLDSQAHHTATELRYTALALRYSRDSAEVELRRLLAIGLTDEAVDAAAMEAGARAYIRGNIGFRVARVKDEAAVAQNVEESIRRSDNEKGNK